MLDNTSNPVDDKAEAASTQRLPEGPPVITDANQYTGPLFKADLLEVFRAYLKEKWVATVQRAATWNYYSNLHPTLPKIHDLTPFDVPAIMAIRNINAGETWPEFAKRCNLKLERRNDENNPWLPSFVSKNPDNPTSWNRSIADTPLETNQGVQVAFVKLLKDASPYGGGTGLTGSVDLSKAFSAVGTMPTDDIPILGEILDAFLDLHRFWFRPLGADYLDPEFHYGKPLCLLGGLGFNSIRVAAQKLRPCYEGWDYWESCTDEKLHESVLSARRIHGYPLALLRIDASTLTNFLIRWDCAPGDWFTPSILLHILKYARFSYRGRGTESPVIQIIRDGHRNLIPLDRSQLSQEFGMNANIKLRTDLLHALGLPASVPSGQTSSCAEARILSIINMLRPSDLCKLRAVDELTHLAIPKAVRLVPTMKHVGEYMFVDYGVGATNVARIDYETGDVVIEDVLTGLDIGAINWPECEMTDAERMTWAACLPKKVEPMLPSETVFKYVHNCNDLGFKRARDAVFNAWVVVDLCRNHLAGSELGNALVVEFPIAMILPMGHTKDDTTNQGKTNLGRIMMHAVCPNVPVIIPSRSSSAPAQRAAASPLDEFGTAFYDEFQLPSSHEHFLAQAGLQSLATGGTVTPGRALENSKGYKLKHSMVICAKISAFPVDIRNRSFCFFMDVLTDETRCSDKELAIIGTGVASNTVRMNAMAWIEKIDFVEKIKKFMPRATKYNRFPAFTAVAIALCCAKGGTEQELFDYFEACSLKCEDQHAKSTESGLSDEIGANGQLCFIRYLTSCSEKTLAELSAASKAVPMTAQDMCLALIQDSNARRYEHVLREYHASTRSAETRFALQVKAGKLVRDGHRADGSVVSMGWKVIAVKGKVNNLYQLIRAPDLGPVSGAPSVQELKDLLAKDGK